MANCFCSPAAARRGVAMAAAFACLALSGCAHLPWSKSHEPPPAPPPPPATPRELCKTALPNYIIEPPDILTIDILRVVPKAPYRLTLLDQVAVQVVGAYPDQPIHGVYAVDPGGVLNFGPAYPPMPVAGLTVPEATRLIEDTLRKLVQNPRVSLSVVESSAKQQIAGEHLVGPDGRVNLGVYGGVFITGMTLEQAKVAIEMHLSRFLESPQIALDVFTYNSKVYYVITEGAGYGDRVYRFPVTGNETVLDAIAQVNGLTEFSSKKIWVARPAPGGLGHDQIMLVDWEATIRRGATTTNYQLMPGDRVFVAEDRLVAFDSYLARIISPMERVLGFTLLGTETVQSINRFPKGYGVGVVGF